MLLYRLVLFICFTLILSSKNIAQSIRINEVQASNSIYQDEDGDTPDWIELHNFSNQAINVEGWSLTDDLGNDTYWTFNNTVIDAGIYGALWASGKDRKGAGSARSLVREDDAFRYIVPLQNLGNEWKNIGYNDSSWNQGQGGFGYGDGDDTSIVPNGTRSVFIRKEFNIDDVEAIVNLYLDIDYDDAFVAFINGVEIARDNIDGAVPNYLSLANTDKEAKVYTGEDPDHYELIDYLDLLRNGDNVLAIQVHNNVTSSSDMTLRPFLTARYNATTQEGSEVHPLLDYRASRMHTDFKISSQSETVYLIEPNGVIHDSIVIQNLTSDISYGYTPNGDLGYFNIATPDEINPSLAFEGFLADEIMFSNDGGQVSALTLSLSTSIPFTTIRYTTDATEPNENSTLYTSPINISSSIIIRAALFRDGYLPSKSVSRNYIIGQNHTIPVMSLISDPVNLFDEEEGIYSYGNSFNNQFPFFGANFWKDEERPIHIGYYGIDNELKVALNAGVKIFGGWSRAFDQRSLSLFARKKYSTKDIEYPIFEERSYESYGALVLRNAGNDNLASNMRDIINHELIKDLDMESQAYQTVATYINDEYWGIYHLREKVNEHFLANKFGLNPDSIDLLEFDAQVISGSNSEYLSMINLVTNGNISDPNVYAAVEKRIDIDNFIDYYTTQIYIDNTDWPGNNNKYWKPKNGKWRWILYDTDFGFNLFQEFGHFNNTLNFALEANGEDWPNPPWSTQLFRGLVGNTSFRIKLVNRFADFMNSRYSTENIRTIVSQKADELQPEILRHYIRWNGNMGEWNNQLNRIRNFADQRPVLMKNHIRAQFGLPAVHNITITNPETNKGYVQISTLTIKDENWDGDYFENNPFIVRAIASPGYTFSHWSGSVNSNNQSLSIDMTNAMTIVPHFEEDINTEPTVVINEINYKSAETTDAGDWIELHNPSTVDIDLTDWIIKDDDNEHEFIIPELTIIAGGFLVIIRDQNKFINIHTDVDFVDEINFGLGNIDQVRLYNSDSQLIDSVSYSNITPWPTLANGNGYTLELINPSLDNSLPENYNGININGSPGKHNILSTSTSNPIEDITSSFVYPNPTKNVLTLNLNLLESNNFEINILDNMGRILQSIDSVEFEKGPNEIKLDIKNLSAGYYTITLRDRNGQTTNTQFIKAK